MNKVRTTFTLENNLLQQLKQFVATNGRTMSSVVEEGLEYVIQKAEEKRLENMYHNLSKLEGIAEDTDPKTANKTVDEIMYGQKSAWDGSLREDSEK